MYPRILPSDRSFINLLKYNSKNESLELCSDNTVTESLLDFDQELQFITSQNSRIKDPAFHVAITFGEDELIDPEKMKLIAAEYMEMMGYGEQPWKAFLHTDTNHPHFHILSTRVDINTGKKISDSYELLKNQQVSEFLAEKYHVLPPLVQEQNHERGIVRGLNERMQKMMRKRPHSFHALSALCEEEGVKVIKSKKHAGYVFFIEGEKKGIGSSSLEVFKTKGLTSQLRANSHYRTKAKKFLVEQLTGEMGKLKNSKVHYNEFRDPLREQKILVKLHRHDTEVYGISFKYNGFEFKGSELGREFTWANINRHIKPYEPLKEVISTRAKIHHPQGHVFDKITGQLRRYNTGVAGDVKPDQDEEEEERKKREREEKEGLSY